MSFWEQFLEYLYMAASGIAAIITLVAFRRRYAIYWRLFSVFLCLCFTMECFAFYLSRHQIANHWLYNPFVAATFLVHAGLFYHLLKKPVYKKIIIAYVVLLFVFIFVNWFFLQPINRLQTNITVAGGVGSFILSITYCIQLYNSTSTVKIIHDRGFWISAGLILNYAAVVPFMGLLNYLWEHYPEFTYMYFVYVMNIVYILTSIAVMIAFLCPDKSSTEKEPAG